MLKLSISWLLHSSNKHEIADKPALWNLLISNIWGIWPEERSLDDKAAPLSLGPSYALCTVATGHSAAPFPQQHLPQSFSLPTLTVLLIICPSGSSRLVGMQWHGTGVWISASPRIRDAEHTFIIFWPTFQLWKDVYLRIGLSFYQGVRCAAAKLSEFRMEFVYWPLIRSSSVSS